MGLPSVITQNYDALIELCQQYKVDKLYAFGSVLTDRFDAHTSDLDLIVELEPMSPLEKGETLIMLWEAFETLFARKVDLLTDQPIKNPYLRQNIERTKQLIYDRKSEKIPV
mgnify:CR=1 FL=1